MKTRCPERSASGSVDVGILQLRWMVDKKMEENQRMLKEEVTRDGVKKGVFRRREQAE